jgi:hypothetical protein
MKQNQGIVKRLLTAMLVAVAVINLSALAMRTPNQNQNYVGLKSIQTDKATMFYAYNRRNRTWFIEAVLPGTAESQAATENLKAVAATL